jgi:hypothetical protein
MESTILILSVLSCATSSGGFAVQYFGKTDNIKKLIGMIFSVAALFSCYILFVPGNKIYENVESKIRYYSVTSKNDVLIQEGNFSFSGSGPYTIQFNEPYLERPKVHILNPNNYDESEIPRMEKATNQFFEVKRYGSSGLEFVPTFLQEYKWIAQGKPLKK